MPDVTRSDSQRSDSSLRPRVSFNRDVHVKRIGIVPNESPPRVVGALIGDGAGHLHSPVRKARLSKSKQKLAEEAARVLDQVDKIDNLSHNRGKHSRKFYTLPVRRKHGVNIDSPQSSISRKSRRRKSEELGITTNPPRKPPRTFIHYPKSDKHQKPSIFQIFKKSEKESSEPSKKSNLKRSVSDASNLKSKVISDSETDTNEVSSNVKGKKQLSPIIEVIQSEDYFSHNNKENITDNIEEHADKNNKRQKSLKKDNQNESVTQKLKEYIDEVDSALFYETGIKVNVPENEKKRPEIVIIDVDKAKKISKNKDKYKFYSGKLSKIKFLGNKKEKAKNLKNKTNLLKNEQENFIILKNQPKLEHTKAAITLEPKIKEIVDDLQQGKKSPIMMHSSQKPTKKLPLTRGYAVDNMVKILNSDNKSSSPPPKSGILITPNTAVQHNNNQPFSYTRGHSPERNSKSPVSPSSPVIYAHVVCDKSGLNNSGTTKQTVHTTYTNGRRHMPHSDSDEGLGNEENSSFGKSFTHFGDEQFKNEKNNYSYSNSYKNTNHFTDEFPIAPNVKSNGHVNGYNNKYTKTEHNIFIDSSSRGRGDGMDSKRRESLTEPHEEDLITPKYNINAGRTDLSARRDLLESRINRRLVDKSFRQSPPTNGSPYSAQYISETSKHYRNGSTSPVGFIETYASETKTGKNGERYFTESRERKNINENDSVNYNNRYKSNGYRSYENEPKSFHSQASDYRSSPENNSKRVDASHEYKYSQSSKYKSKDDKQKLEKDKQHYKSNPEIVQRYYDNTYKYNDHDKYQETYHDSLKRDKQNVAENSSNYYSERYFDRNDSERKDKLGDSGIENDFNRDRTPRSSTQRHENYNESEDEGFASSLLIASERQHTEDNFNNRRSKRDYDSDKSYREDRDNVQRNADNADYKIKREYKTKYSKHEYTPRERSIDDGSHYDPRIDKDVNSDRSAVKKKTDKKPPKPTKPAKLSSLEKVKQLFTRDPSKKNKNGKDRSMVPESNLRARYTEYKGSRENLEEIVTKKNIHNVKTGYDYNYRRRLSTPSPSPTREPQQTQKPTTHGSWFKSLDRLSRKKAKKNEKEVMSEEETLHKTTPTKNLRFFGDTDIESNDSIRYKPSIKSRSSLSNSAHQDRGVHSHSTRDLHNISEERQTAEFVPPFRSSTNHKSLLNISESDRDIKGSRISLKPPASPSHRNVREVSRGREENHRRKRNDVSSVESSTEGDSSQQSQRNVVYLHAATVGDIPGPGYLRAGRRAASREELTSNGSANIRPQVKTLSRSFSVLAPWRPRHHKDNIDIDYSQQAKPIKNGKYEQKITKNGNNRKDNSSTLKKKANETRRLNQSSTLNRKSRSKENVSSQILKKSKEDLTKGSTSTLYKKKEKQPKENNSRYSKDREDRRISSKSMSVESLGNGGSSYRSNGEKRDVSRSVSMPRDPEKSAGWFKINKKSNKSISTHRL